MKKLLTIADKINKLHPFHNSKLLRISNLQESLNPLSKFQNDINKAMPYLNNIQELSLHNKINSLLPNIEIISINAPQWSWFATLPKSNSWIKVVSISLKLRKAFKIVKVQLKLEDNQQTISEVFNDFKDRIKYEFNGMEVRHKEVFEKIFNEEYLDVYLELSEEDIIKKIWTYAESKDFFFKNAIGKKETVKNEKPKIETFDELFKENFESKNYVINAMVDLMIMDNEGQYLLGNDRKFLASFIEIMLEYGKIPNEKITPLFRIFAKKFGLNPRLPHNTGYKKSKIESYLIFPKK